MDIYRSLKRPDQGPASRQKRRIIGGSGSRAGFNTVELLIAVALVGLAFALALPPLKSLSRGLTRESRRVEAQVSLRDGLRALEKDLRGMVRLSSGTATEIRFRLDSHRIPGFPYDRLNPDLDGDAVQILTVNIVDAWKVGYNLHDDDDDGDSKIDVQCRYYVLNGDLARDFNYNEEGWGNRVEVIVPSLATGGLAFTYWGMKNHLDSARLDKNPNDGIISAGEIDVNGGNGNGSLDTVVELHYVTTIRLDVKVDRNRDGQVDFSLQSEVSPVPLQVGGI